jgi:hypothetical protein
VLSFHDEARADVLDRPGRRKAARLSHQLKNRPSGPFRVSWASEPERRGVVRRNYSPRRANDLAGRRKRSRIAARERRATSHAGLIAALRYLLDAGLNRERVLVHGDSQLVINQMFGRWRIKGGCYADLAREAKTWRARTSEKTLSIDLMAQRRFPPHGQSRILALAFGLP